MNYLLPLCFLLPQSFERCSVNTLEREGNGQAMTAAITPDGRYVAFASLATNMVRNDTNGTADVFLRDRTLGTTERVSLTFAGQEISGGALGFIPAVAISADAMLTVFVTDCPNVVPNDTNGNDDVFVRNRISRTTSCVSLDMNGVPGKGGYASISSSGRYVAFYSGGTNMTPSGQPGVHVRDLFTGTTTLIDAAGGPNRISANGRYVVYDDYEFGSPSLVSRYDLRTNTKEFASVGLIGGLPNANCFNADISSDGRYVVFMSQASNLVSGDQPGPPFSIFRRDMVAGTTIKVSTPDTKNFEPRVSPDGRFVSGFEMTSDSAVPDWIWSYDVTLATRTNVSDKGYAFDWSAGGHEMLFWSNLPLVAGDTNLTDDTFTWVNPSAP